MMSSKTVVLLAFLASSQALDFGSFCDLTNFSDLQEKFQEALGDPDAALRMVDAWTKFPSGILNGNFYDLGNFDECYSIEVGDIYGKYCLGSLQYSGISVHFAACIPSNWSVSEISSLIVYNEDECVSKKTESGLSSGSIATITVLSIFGAIVCASTIFDIYLYYSKRSTTRELLLAFSVLSNGRKLLQTSTDPDQLLCLNGIKAISMMWIILAHVYSLGRSAPLINFLDLQKWQKDAFNMYIFGGSIAVDTFLTVGGLVTAYIFLKGRHRGVKFNIGLYYLHRYLRLTPALAVMVLVHLFLLNHMGNGPLWKIVDNDLVQGCERSWWSTLLYITNYVQRGNCVPPTWYLTVDMQLFVLSPLVLIPLYKRPKLGLGLLACLIFAGCLVPFSVSMVERIGSMFTGTDLMSIYYFPTYTRFGPYVIGMTLGYFIWKIKANKAVIELRPMIVASLWLFFVGGLVSCVYAAYPLHTKTEADVWGNSLFLAFDRQGWAVCVCGVIFMCVAGYGGPVDGFLSLGIFQFLTKLSYSMYLVHYAVIVMRYSGMKTNMKFSDLSMMHSFWGDFMATLALSLILCLTFESPVIILEKHLLGGRAASKLKDPNKNLNI